MILKRVIPVVVLAGVLIAYIALDGERYISFDALAGHQAWLMKQVADYPFLAPFSYVLLYIAVVAFSLPGGLVMTVAGGFLFGTLAGGTYAVIGATIGATILFLVAKTSWGDFLLHKAGDSVKKMQRGFADDALSYMLVLRLVPLFPFFLVNLVPAFLGVPLRIYLLATFFGIMPATFIFALAGSGVGSILQQGQGISVAGVMTPQVIGALLGLAALAMIPVLYKHLGRRPGKGSGN